MDFCKRLKSLRLSRSLTQQALGERVGVSVITVRNWESGCKRPSMNAIIALSECLDVSCDYMLGTGNRVEREIPVLDRREQRLVGEYRKLDTYGKTVVDTVCRLEFKRVESRNTQPAIPAGCRYIPKYVTPSAAGVSFPLDGDDFEMIPVTDDVPSKADFAVCIQGDSMLPYIHDGDTVYVLKTRELSIGDVGIFSVDGAMYCKQYYLDGDGNLTLVSANPRLKKTNVCISADCGSDVRCFGKVLLDRKIPLPDYFLKSIK